MNFCIAHVLASQILMKPLNTMEYFWFEPWICSKPFGTQKSCLNMQKSGKCFIFISIKIHWIFIPLIFQHFWRVLLQLTNWLFHFHVDKICVFLNDNPIFHNYLQLFTEKGSLYYSNEPCSEKPPPSQLTPVSTDLKSQDVSMEKSA